MFDTVFETAQRLLGIDRSDRNVLRILGPTFAMTAATMIIIATVSKALFLSSNPISRLPWVFMGSGIFTSVAAVAYVALMPRFGLKRRFPGLLGVSLASFILLWLLFPNGPETMSLLIFVWAPGMGHLIILQTWNMTTSTVPTRQCKRLIPLLAGIATVGAASGGAAVAVALKWIPAEHLLLVAAVLLAWPAFRIVGVITALHGALPEPDEVGPKPPAKGERGQNEVVRGFRSIRDTPLLLRLAGFVFLLQVASVFIDFQFSGELKNAFGKDEMASFLGAFYWLSNIVVLLVSFFATSRIVRVLGIGVALSGVAVMLGLGSIVYMFVAASAGKAFWIIAGIAFLERIGQFALTKSAVQMLITPLDTRKGERAKTLIDGVVYRVATIAVSVVLLVVAAEEKFYVFSPAVIIAAVAIVWLGLRIGPHYRKALLEGLRARRLDTVQANYQRLGLGRGMVREVQQRIEAAQDPVQLRNALSVAAELNAPIDPALLERLALHPWPQIPQQVLATMQAQGAEPSRELMLRLLEPDKPPEVLRAALSALRGRTDHVLDDAAAELTRHEDIGVAALATVMRMRAESKETIEQVTAELEEELTDDLDSDEVDRRARAVRVIGSFDFAGLRDRFAADIAEGALPKALKDPELRVRLEAVDAMGRFRLKTFLPPLIRALGYAELRPTAVEALGRFGPELIEAAAIAFQDPKLRFAARTSLISVVERSDAKGVKQLLLSWSRLPDYALRDHALAALWRQARDPAREMQPRMDWIKAAAAEELELLHRLLRVEGGVRHIDERARFFLAELETQRARAERRVFLLLSLLYNRAALHRALLHYRSPNRRTRSNAVELLDQHVRDKDLREFVDLVERVEEDGRLVPRALSEITLNRIGGVGELVAGQVPWLSRVWGWASPGGLEPVPDPEVDLVVLLKGIPLFAEMSGETLLPVAGICRSMKFDEGEVIFEQGDEGDRLYLIIDGEVEVVAEGKVVTRLGERECVGELAILDGAPRSATIRCSKPTGMLAITAADFHEQLDLHSALGRGIMGMLSRRIRAS